MDETFDHLAAMLDKTGGIIARIDEADHGLPTPCEEYDVGGLLEHVAVWVQVFEAAVTGRALDFDPMTHRVGSGWGDRFVASSAAIVAGLRADGVDRSMTMTADPIPGVFVLNMLLMEYLGHGWDLAKAVGLELPYTEKEAAVALEAAEAIIEPQYRGHGMFGDEVEVGPGAAAVDRFVAFIGRDPSWQGAATAAG